MTATIKTLATKTNKSHTQQLTTVVKPKSQLIATWILEDDRLVCKWLIAALPTTFS